MPEFPSLAGMARDNLRIPLTSVSVERLFSSARDVMPYSRNRLGAPMIQDLLIAKSWEKRRSNSGMDNRELDDFHIEGDIDNELGAVQAFSPDVEFLQRMVPVPGEQEFNDRRSDDSDSDGDVDLEATDKEWNVNENPECSPFDNVGDSGTRSLFIGQSSEGERVGEPSTPTPRRNKRRKDKDLAVITTPVTGRLRKRIRKNYQM